MELSDPDKDELVQMIRDAVQKVEDIYRPARATMTTAQVDSDPVIAGLYGCRDNLIAAERSILGIGLRLPELEGEGGAP